MAWPKKVPILEASDICRQHLDGANGTHCLWGWSGKVFRASGYEEEVDEALREEAGVPYLPEFNDSPLNSRAKVAAVWNRVMRKLGYTVPCER